MAENDAYSSLVDYSEAFLEEWVALEETEEISEVYQEEGLESAGCKCKSQCTRRLKTAASGKVSGYPCKGFGLRCGSNCTCGTRSKPCKNKTQSEPGPEQTPGPAQACESDQTAEEILESLPFEKLLAVGKIGFMARKQQLQDIIANMANETTCQHPANKIESVPSFCVCRNCREMPTDKERICCKQRSLCRSRTNIFHNICKESDNLATAIRRLADTYVFTASYDKRAMRHASYRQYVMWQHGYLGKGHCHVIPSCCVLQIKKYYPSPDGCYTGYKD